MRKFTLSFLLFLFALAGYSTTWVVTNAGFSFSPAMLTISEGDTVVFTLANEHNSVEVSQATWNANGNTPLAGGWALPFGGGMVLPADLTVGTHYYVCQPHASGGMKGIIVVESTTSTDDQYHKPSFSVYPNPSNGIIALETAGISTGKNFRVEIYNMHGHQVFTATNEETSIRESINLSDEPKGMYIIRLFDDQGILTKKLILQ